MKGYSIYGAALRANSYEPFAYDRDKYKTKSLVFEQITGDSSSVNAGVASEERGEHDAVQSIDIRTTLPTKGGF